MKDSYYGLNISTQINTTITTVKGGLKVQRVAVANAVCVIPSLLMLSPSSDRG
jgi:ABC-type taurine transport system ATPase subunit